MTPPSTKTLPLLSDEAIERMSGDPLKAQAVSSYEFGKTVGMARGLASARNIYETARKESDDKIARLEGLVQELVDALAWHSGTLQQTIFYDSFPEMLMATDAALSSAKALDFEPKTTT